MASDQKRHGQTYTPEPISSFLVNWAVREPTSTVLEPAVGKGRFVFDVYDRLLELGASAEAARAQIYGVDIDEDAVKTLQRTAAEQTGARFPNIDVQNLFETEFPEVDALVGNPPYVIRHRLDVSDEVVDQFSNEYDISRRSDLYVYFLLQAASFLAPGGRMAMIFSNSWMKQNYGERVKQFLLRQFHVRELIGFRERVFGDLVNSVCILAEKRSQLSNEPTNNTIRFVQADSPEIFNSDDEVGPETVVNNAVQSVCAPQEILDAEEYWDIWLRAPEVFAAITDSDEFVQLSEFATPMIGLQTLAKEFFILSEDDVEEHDIEPEFVRPIAYSPADHQSPEIRAEGCPYQVFWCSDSREDLAGTAAREYIDEAENRTVTKRYSDETYEGLHNKPRICQANRDPWYNLTEEAERRLPAPILLPRRVYETFFAFRNPEGVIPNENFLATTVTEDRYLKPLLAYLNSSLGELVYRLAGHIYGGGICDLNVSSSKHIPTIDLGKRTSNDLTSLRTAFDEFVESKDRAVLDEIVYTILGFSNAEQAEIREALDNAVDESLRK